MNVIDEVIYKIDDDLNKIADLILDIIPAQSCFIFLPTEVMTGQVGEGNVSGLLQLAGYASTKKIDLKHRSKSGTGIVGWVSKNNQSTIINDFQHSPQSLGFYSEQTTIGSLISVPIKIDFCKYDWHQEEISGVLYCDNTEPNSFNKAIENILNKFSHEISKNVKLCLKVNSNIAKNLNLQDFSSKVDSLITKLGKSSLEIMKIKLKNSVEIEEKLGISQFVLLFQKMQRLIQQVLPQQYPIIHLPSGETLIVMDNIVTKYYENKIRIMAAHISPDNLILDYEFSNIPIATNKKEKITIDQCYSNVNTAIPKNEEKKKRFKIFRKFR